MIARMTGHVKALTGALAALALILGAGAAVVPAVLASSASAATALTLATGDSRSVSQPSVPSACTTLSATLATSNEQFSSSAESSPPDTSRIQSALNGCSGTGKAVVLAPSGSNNAFLSGPLSLPASVVLVVDDGATLYASRNPASYQVSGQATCGTVASSGNGCKPFINVTGSNAGIMGTQGSGGGQGAINGRGDQDILGTSGSWWTLSNTAKTDGNKQNNPRLIEAHGVNSFTVYDVDLINAPLFHIYFEGGNGLTVWGARIKTPATARNTDGIDPDSATNVTVNDSYIQAGDDGIAIKTNSGAASNMTVENSHFYGTHGISIGSQTQYGVTNILVENNTVSGVDSSGNVSGDNNGIRIKTTSSEGGTVNKVTYDNTCLTGVKHALEFRRVLFRSQARVVVGHLVDRAALAGTGLDPDAVVVGAYVSGAVHPADGVVLHQDVGDAVLGLAADPYPVRAVEVAVLDRHVRGGTRVGLDRYPVVAVLDVGVVDGDVGGAVRVNAVGVPRGRRGLDPGSPHGEPVTALEVDVEQRTVDQVNVIDREAVDAVRLDQARVVLLVAVSLRRLRERPPASAGAEDVLVAPAVDGALAATRALRAHDPGVRAGDIDEGLAAVAG